MNFRNIMFIISITMIGFCFTLYFQSDLDVQTINYDRYKDLTYNESRSHSLEELNNQILPLKMEGLIQEIIEKNKAAGERTRIMEIGAGNGRVLMTLKKMFPEAEFYGINKEKTMTFYRRESFILTALKFDIATKAELEGMELPYIVFQDLDFGRPIPYADNKFDLIYSQTTIPHIKYKFELFAEITRVLKKGALSVHTDVSYLNVYNEGIVMDFRDALKEIRRKGVEIYQLENLSTIKFKKPEIPIPFPVTPHQPLPDNIESLTPEQRRPEMGYNFISE